MKINHVFNWIGLLLVSVGASSAVASVTLVDKGDWKVGIYGFVESDAIVDTTRSLSESTGNAPVDRPTTFSGDNGRTQFSIRNSRLGFTVGAPKANDWDVKGVMEFDFLGANGGSGTAPEAVVYNNPVLRARHFYLQAEADGWQLLAGQYWTLFGWQPAYFLATLSVAPVSGVAYQRTAQFTAVKNVALTESNAMAFGVSIVRPAQRDSRFPGLDAGVKWAWNGRRSGLVGMTSGEPKAQPLSVGLSGRLNGFAYNGSTDTQSRSHKLGAAVAFDALVPIVGSSEDKVENTLTLTGEVTAGQGYSEAFPGFSGNLPAYSSSKSASGDTNLNVDAGELGIDPVGGPSLVHLTTFNLQLQYHLPVDRETFVTAGYGAIYSNNIAGLSGGTPTPAGIYDRDETCFVNLGHNLTKALRLAAEGDVIRTTYGDGTVGRNARIMASAFLYF